MIKKGDSVYAFWCGTALNGSPGDIGVVLAMPGEPTNYRYVVPAETVMLVARAGNVVATRCQRCKNLFACDLTGDNWLCERCSRLLGEIAATVPGRKSEEKASD